MDIQQFKVLGREVDEAWRARQYDEFQFSEVALEVLGNASLSTSVDLQSILERCLDPAANEFRIRGSFGDLPLIVYETPQFYVQVLMWTTATTNIHQHGFSGAFRVFAGSSIHSQYEFHTRERINSRISVGDAELKTIELLRQGQTHEIISGSGLTHALFHLDLPSVSVVVRTHAEPWSSPQMTLYPPHLAVDTVTLGSDPVCNAIAKCLRVMRHAQDPRIADSIISLVPRLDFARIYQVFQRHRQQLGSEEGRFLDAVRERHGQLTDHMLESMQYERRLEKIRELRGTVRDLELRFFLGVLLNAPNQKRIYELVAAQYPEVDPEDKVVEWLTGLLRTGEFPAKAGVSLLRPLLRGSSLEETVRAVGDAIDDTEAQPPAALVATMCEQIKGVPAFDRLWIRN